MTLACGEALIDLFVGPPEGTEMPARAVACGEPGLSGACNEGAHAIGIVGVI
jgi:fructokinase